MIKKVGDDIDEQQNPKKRAAKPQKTSSKTPKIEQQKSREKPYLCVAGGDGAVAGEGAGDEEGVLEVRSPGRGEFLKSTQAIGTGVIYAEVINL